MNANDIRTLTDNANAARTQTFTYDLDNRLLTATGVYGDRTYTYDDNGNRQTEERDTNPATDYEYGYEGTGAPSHRLLSTVEGTTPVTYGYDNNGNTVSRDALGYVYGQNNRLKSVQSGGVDISTYVYNGRGERVKKDDGTNVIRYVYGLAGELLAELDEAGNTTREYIYLNGVPATLTDNGEVYFIHTDHLGTPQAITDDTPAIVWDADYEPFGEASVNTAYVENNLRFPGQYFDVAGLMCQPAFGLRPCRST